MLSPTNSRSMHWVPAPDPLSSQHGFMGRGSVLVEHMSEYMESLEKVRDIGLTVLNPGHGEPMEDPDEVIDWYMGHRLERERQIIAAIKEGARTIGEIVEVCYVEIDPAFFLMAAKSVGSHLRKLASEGMIELPFGSSDWLSRVVFPILSTEDENGSEDEG